MSRGSPRNGFSLVELSIVLVILGLLTGGILAGQSLIRAAELRSVVSDMQRYQAAIHTFRDQYMALPGDMPNATRFWGIAGGTGNDAACANTVSTGTATCNGNGNGSIRINVIDLDETYRTPQHLANAGLIEGQYSGSINGLASADLLQRATPRGRISNSGFMFLAERLDTQGWTGPNTTATINRIRFGGPIASAPIRIGTAILSGEETWNIDTKLDDGRPGTGRVTAHAIGSCITTTDTSTSEYMIASGSNGRCMLHYDF